MKKTGRPTIHTKETIDYVLGKMEEYVSAVIKKKEILDEIKNKTGLTYHQIWTIRRNAQTKNS